MADFKSAANCFLNGLILNPKVEHLWTYLRTSFLQMGRMDLIEKLEVKDPFIFKDEFQLIDPKQQMKPSFERLYDNALLKDA